MEVKQPIDVAIIGGGPAGMTAGLYASRAGLSAVAFEGMTLGGQVANIKTIDNYPGFAEGIGGFDLAWACKEQAERFGTMIAYERVVAADLGSDPKVLKTDQGEYTARTVIIATGARNKKMGVKGEDELHGRGVSYCATCDGGFFRGMRVVVYGGEDIALEDTLYLARICEHVTVVYRRDELRAAAVHVEAAKALPNVDFRLRSKVVALHEEDGRLAAVSVKNLDTGEVERLDTAAVFVAVGNVPNSDLFAGQIELAGEYIVAGEDCATSIPGVYAAGDVRTKKLRQIATAVSDGAIAAEAAREFIAMKER